MRTVHRRLNRLLHRRLNRLLAAALVAVLTTSGAAALASPGTAGALGDVRAIAMFDTAPTALQANALRSLGLTVQPLEHLPMALVAGPAAALDAIVPAGLARDVYPDERLAYFDQASADAMGAALPRAAGLTGRGVTVGVVDSGCDASHPDLADHVTHNVKLLSAEYANLPPDSSNTLVVPVEAGPYQNTDLGSGHGTHVAGIIAADGTTDPANIGVAPDAELVCYAIGEVIATTAVVTAYDHMLDQPDLWGIDVVNNSWGNSWQQYDPRHPVNVATRAVADLGVDVVFAAGNAGSDDAEATLNPFSQAPWVTSVAAGTLDHHRGDFSSNGHEVDNSQPVAIGAGGHTVFTGDRLGVYHPDVTAPGVDISSTCDTAGTVVGPCPPPDYTNTTASGTSMASPHVAGAAAVLLQANPALTITQLRQALQATATPVLAADGTALPFWQAGYGYVDLAAAADLVRARRFDRQVTQRQAAADQRVTAAQPYVVHRSDFWTYDAPRLAAGGSDQRTFAVAVPDGISHLKVTLAHPSLGTVGANLMEYTVTVRDANGQVLGTTTENPSAGTATLLVDLGSFANPAVARGAFTFEVRGEMAASDPDTIDSESALGRFVVLQVAQLTLR
jgi:serine protease AprX